MGREWGGGLVVGNMSVGSTDTVVVGTGLCAYDVNASTTVVGGKGSNDSTSIDSPGTTDARLNNT